LVQPGLVNKDSGATEKAIAAFEQVTKIVPTERTLLLHRIFEHATAEIWCGDFGVPEGTGNFSISCVGGIWNCARLSAQGRCRRAKEHLQKFQKTTANHLGTPFGAGYGDQGKFFAGGVCAERRADGTGSDSGEICTGNDRSKRRRGDGAEHGARAFLTLTAMGSRICFS